MFPTDKCEGNFGPVDRESYSGVCVIIVCGFTAFFNVFTPKKLEIWNQYVITVPHGKVWSRIFGGFNMESKSFRTLCTGYLKLFYYAVHFCVVQFVFSGNIHP